MLQIEQLENEVRELKQVLSDKKEQEAAMLQVCFIHLFFHECEVPALTVFFLSIKRYNLVQLFNLPSAIAAGPDES